MVLLENPSPGDAGGYCSPNGIGADLTVPTGKQVTYVDEGWSWFPPETDCKAYEVDASSAGPYRLLAAGSYPDDEAHAWIAAISLLPMAAWAVLALAALATRRRNADADRGQAPPA